MAKKQQIILLHGSEKFTDKTLLVKGEVAIEHGSSAAAVKMHTLDNNGEIATFASQAYIDNEATGIKNRVQANETALATLNGDVDTAGSVAKAVNDAKSELSTKIDNSVTTLNGNIDKVSGDLTKAVSDLTTSIGEVSGDLADNVAALEKSIGDNLKTAKEYTDELRNGAVANNTTAITANATAIADIAKDYLTSTDKNTLSNAITAETSAREAAISAETSAREAAINGVNAKIGTVAEGTNLATLIANEVSAREAAISAETSARRQAVTGLQTQIDNLDNTYATDTQLSTAVSTLEGKITAAQNAATTKVVEGTDAGNHLTIETSTGDDNSVTYTVSLTDVASASALTALDGSVSKLIGTVEGDDNLSARQIASDEASKAVADVINGAPEAFNTLKEIADWIGSGDAIEGVTAAEMLTSIEKNKTDIANEVTARTQAVSGLQTQIDGIKDDYLTSSDKTELNNAITAETSARTQAVSGLQSQIGTVADGTNLATLIANEVTARTQGDSGLQGQIDGIKADYLKSSDKTELNNAITAETSAREAAINGVNAKIGTVAEGTNLATLIANEVTARTQAVTGLQTQIDNLDNTYATDTQLSTAVSTLEGKITAAQNAATTKVVEGTDAGNHLTIETSTGDDNSVTYTVSLTDVASASALTALDGSVSTIASNYVKTVQVVSNGTTHTYTPVNNVLDLSAMVIDGGTY